MGAALAVLASGPGATVQAEFVPFSIPEEQARCVLYVDGTSAAAADTNPGTEDAPLKTLGAAASRALEKKAAHVGVKIVVKPGVYREGVILAPPGFRQDAAPGELDTDAPLIIEAQEKGTAILDGAEPWSDWTTSDGGRTWTHAWPHRWGRQPNPWADMGIVFPPLLGRRELVLVDGRPLRMVASDSDLVPGAFTVSEEQGLLKICLPEGKTPPNARIEVGVRAELLIVRGLRNVIVRGLVFQHAADRLYIWPAGFNKTRRAVFEDCTWRWNNWYGFLAYHCEDTILRRCSAVQNGGGSGLGFCRNLLLEDTETSSNNWRGASFNWFAWDTAGIKAMYLHGAVLRRHRAMHNREAGLWLDTDTERVALEDCMWVGNTYGLSLENNQGPLRITRCVAAFNDVGLVIDKTENGVLEDSVVYGNRYGQMIVQGPPSSSFKNWETGERLTTRCQNWVWRNNVIASTSAETAYGRAGAGHYWYPLVCAPLVSMPAMPSMLRTLQSSNNLWHHPLPAAAFQYAGLAFGKEPVAGLSFLEWQAISGQDWDSVFAPPNLVNPDALDFTPAEGSPLRSREHWPRLSRQEIERRSAELHPDVRAFALGQGASTASPQAPPEDPFPLAAQASASAWRPVNLAGVATRPLVGDEAWINIPLPHLPPGRYTFRGVPFEVLDQDRNDGVAVVALRSAAVLTGPRGELPAQVEVPIADRARAAYILHGAGWATNHEQIARYEWVFDDGTTAQLPVTVLGMDPGQGPQAEQAMRESNLQDWWPRHPQFSHTAARSVRLVGDGSPDSDRFLYVVEWVNPHPDKVIRMMRLSSDPRKTASVAVVAITLLK